MLVYRALTGLMGARSQDARSDGADFAAILTPYSAQLRLINSLVRRVPDSEQAGFFCLALCSMTCSLCQPLPVTFPAPLRSADGLMYSRQMPGSPVLL